MQPEIYSNKFSELEAVLSKVYFSDSAENKLSRSMGKKYWTEVLSFGISSIIKHIDCISENQLSFFPIVIIESFSDLISIIRFSV